MRSNAQSGVRRRERGSEHDEWAAAKSARGQSCDFGFGWQHLRVSAYESYFFFFAASAATSAAVTGKGNALLSCCSAVGERERQREGGSSDTA